MSGTLYGVGVGPGDPELLTVKAARLISAAETIIYFAANGGESLARSIASRFMMRGVREIAVDMPMRPDPALSTKVYDDCAARVTELLESGSDVVMLCEGDPLFYGSFAYILERLSGRQHIEIIPAVTSLSAAAAVLASPIALRNDVLKVLPATLPDDRLNSELGACDAAAIIKVGRHLSRIVSVLSRLDLLDRAIAVERATQAGQRILPLATLQAAEVSYFTTIIVKNKVQN